MTRPWRAAPEILGSGQEQRTSREAKAPDFPKMREGEMEEVPNEMRIGRKSVSEDIPVPTQVSGAKWLGPP